MASLSLHISTHPQPTGKLKLGGRGGGKVNFVASLSLCISTHPQPAGKLILGGGGGGKLIPRRLYHCA